MDFGSLMIVKMLHRKNQSKTQRNLSPKPENKTNRAAGTSEKIKCSEVIIKSEEYGGICRVCLKEGSLPILDASKELCESINTIGDIQVRADDPYPKHLCKSCYALLQSAILFRKTAQKTNEYLIKQRNSIKLMTPAVEIVSDESKELSDGIAEEDANTCLNNKNRPIDCRKLPSCKKCDLQFNTAQELSDHRLSAEHQNKRSTCNICKKTYGHRYFTQHMALHKKPFMCDICGNKFLVPKAQFQRHRMTHFNELPFQCEHCPYRGRFPESLKLHMRTHTGEKPYQCAHCPSRFINNSNLRRHMLSHKERCDFQCEVCSRGFHTKRDLELHIRVDHTGIREHICETCGKAFGYRSQMKKHELKVHKRKKLRKGKQAIWCKIDSMKQNLDLTNTIE